MCQSLFLNKVAGLRPVTLLKKTLAQVFFCEFCEIFKNTFFPKHLWATASGDRVKINVVIVMDSRFLLSKY